MRPLENMELDAEQLQTLCANIVCYPLTEKNLVEKKSFFVGKDTTTLVFDNRELPQELILCRQLIPKLVAELQEAQKDVQMLKEQLVQVGDVLENVNSWSAKAIAFTQAVKDAF
jgi:hypothetical protein